MRKLTGAVFVSLDGIMQAPGGPEEDPTGGFQHGGWTFPFFDQSAQAPMAKFLFEPEYDLLLGKRTYDIFSAYWPHHLDNPVGEKFDRIDKYVLTDSDEPLGWAHSHRISGDTAAAVAELKRSEGRDLLIQGSSTLYPPLLAAGLVDKLLLMTFPVLLGHGKSIFNGNQGASRMKLTDHDVTDTGVTFATYEQAGEVPTGSFADDAPSEAERQRREKMREGIW